MTSSAPTTSPAPVHPRVRARRIEVERDEGRRRLRRVIGVLSALSLAAISWAAVRSPLLDVDEVVVAGAARTPAGEVRSASAVQPGDAMIDLDPGAVRRRVEALPWVASAVVRREWPGRLRISVSERHPRASVAAGEAWVLVDATGRVLEVIDTPAEGIPVVEGLSDAPPPGRAFAGLAPRVLDVLASLPEAAVAAVEAAVVVADDDVRLRLVEGGEVRWGRPDLELEAKAVALATVLERVDLRSLAVIDVRVPATPVVTRR